MIDQTQQGEMCKQQSGAAPPSEGDVKIAGRTADRSVELGFSVGARYLFDICKDQVLAPDTLIA